MDNYYFCYDYIYFTLPHQVVPDEIIYTLPVGITTFYGSYTLKFGVTLADNVIVSLPILVFFIFFQRQLIEGITLSGLKE